MLRRNSWLVGVGLCVSVAIGSACSTTIRDGYADDADGGGSSGGNNSNGGSGGDFNSSGGLPVSGAVKIKGTTYAPNGTLPLSGVLIYTLEQKPDPIPEGVYCDTCRELPENRFALSNSDGSFEFTADPGKRFVVVEKGQFRRVREIDIESGTEEIDLQKELSTLPSRSSSNGDDTIPKIALMTEPGSTTVDMIQTALRGLGVENWDNFAGSKSKVTLENLRNYHIVMFPCGSGAPTAGDREVLKEFVKEGGKVYASDHSLGYATATFPEFFQSTHSTWSTSAKHPSGRYVDEGMRAWLSVPAVDTGNPDNARFEGVWSNFNGVRSAEVPDETGNFSQQEPKLWAEVSDSGFGTGEAAVSFQYGCGRTMASIFHVHGTSTSDLMTQEKALIYMLLDVSACAGPPVPVN